MNGDTAELLDAINKCIKSEVKPLRDDIGKIRSAVQDRGERLAKVEEKTENIGDCGGNAEKIDEASRGVTSNRMLIFSLVLALLAGVVALLKWG